MTGPPMAEVKPVKEAPQVFISYKWAGASEALAQEIEEHMRTAGILVTRDKNTLKYRDSIRRFMRRMGASRGVIIILDDEYLRSKNCMFELTEIARCGEYASRVYPIIMASANIFDPIGRLEYIGHWEKQRGKLDAAMKKVGQENLQGIREELDLYEEIRNTIARIMDVLAGMNTLTPDIHRGTDFAELYGELATALT